MAEEQDGHITVQNVKDSFGISDDLDDLQIAQMVSDANGYVDSMISLYSNSSDIGSYSGMAKSIAVLHFESAYRRRANYSESLSESISKRLESEVKIFAESLRKNTRKTSEIHSTQWEEDMSHLTGQLRGLDLE